MSRTAAPSGRAVDPMNSSRSAHASDQAAGRQPCHDLPVCAAPFGWVSHAEPVNQRWPALPHNTLGAQCKGLGPATTPSLVRLTSAVQSDAAADTLQGIVSITCAVPWQQTVLQLNTRKTIKVAGKGPWWKSAIGRLWSTTMAYASCNNKT